MPVCFAVMYPFVPRMLAAQPLEVRHAARWILLAIPLYAAIVVGTNTVRGANKLIHWNLLRLLPGAGWLVFLAGAWIWGLEGSGTNRFRLHRGPGLHSGARRCAIAGRLSPWSWSPSAKLATPMLRYGLPLAGAAIPQTLNLRLDQILIGAFLPPYQLGLYVAAVAWSTAVFLMPNAIGNVLFPKIASATASPADRAANAGSGSAYRHSDQRHDRNCSRCSYSLRDSPAFWEGFCRRGAVAYVLIIAAVICALNIIFEESLRRLGRNPRSILGRNCRLGHDGCGIGAALPPLGIIGAGLASILGYATTCAVLMFRICGSTGFSMASLLPRRADLRFLALRLQGWWLIAGQRPNDPIAPGLSEHLVIRISWSSRLPHRPLSAELPS